MVVVVGWFLCCARGWVGSVVVAGCCVVLLVVVVKLVVGLSFEDCELWAAAWGVVAFGVPFEVPYVARALRVSRLETVFTPGFLALPEVERRGVMDVLSVVWDGGW